MLPILSALLDEVALRDRVEFDRIHVAGFNMGGYGAWELPPYAPN